jgi:hypothetical protein
VHDERRRTIHDVERQFDELLALYGERRKLHELRAESARLWRLKQRRARMKALVLVIGIVTATSTAGAAWLQQVVSPRNPLLEWWPIIIGLGVPIVTGIMAFVGVRVTQSYTTKAIEANQRDTRAELAKKAEEKVIEARFKGLDDKLDANFMAIRDKFDSISKTLDDLRREIQSNRQRRDVS